MLLRIKLAQDRDRRWTVMNLVMKHWKIFTSKLFHCHVSFTQCTVLQKGTELLYCHMKGSSSTSTHCLLQHRAKLTSFCIVSITLNNAANCAVMFNEVLNGSSQGSQSRLEEVVYPHRPV
jgi:hypothetical protein